MTLSLAAQLYRRLPLRRQVLTAWRRIGSPSALHLFYFDGPFSVGVDADHRFLMCQHNRYGIETAIFWRGLEQGYEPGSMTAWIELCGDAQVVLDVGAAEGVYALIAKCLRPTAQVIAFEPFPPRRRELLRNIRVNGCEIACPEVAISNFEGSAEFLADDEFSVMGTLSELGRRFTRPVRHEVAVTTLAKVVQDFGLERIDLLKLDVEGAEPEALNGMGPLLAEFRPAILIEVLDDAAGERVEAELDGLGYIYFDVDDGERRGARPLLRRPHIRKSAHLNHLAVSEVQANRLAHLTA